MAKLKSEFRAEAVSTGKPENILDKIVESKLDNYYKEVCLLKQPYVLDDKQTIGDMVAQGIADLKENIIVRRFVRYELGGE
jgi:elongation factor Ts